MCFNVNDQMLMVRCEKHCHTCITFFIRSVIQLLLSDTFAFSPRDWPSWCGHRLWSYWGGRRQLPVL